MTEQEQILKIQPRLADRWWRLNNLYYITDQYGKRVLFKPNAVQRETYLELHYLNTILKSRQHGITTLFCILMLDFILWNQNKEAAMTMHGMTEAKGKFASHIKYPFFELPDYILNCSTFKPKTDSQTELILPDEKGNLRTKLSVQAGLRSATYHWVHISEYAKLCAKYPEKAAEVQSGAIETIHQGMILTFESTAEGPSGDFFDKCRQAEQQHREKKPLGPMDYKFFFFGWYWKESNTTDPQYVEVSEEKHEYFDKVEESERVPDGKLTEGQRAWYVKKEQSLGLLMTREHPSTSDEAWFASVKGSFWADEIRDLERRFPPQVTTVPHNPKIPVHTVHDVGYNWAIWFIQDPMGVYPRFIRYYEFVGGGVERCCDLLDDYKRHYGYRYGKHAVPLDADSNATKTINGRTILVNARKNGYVFSRMKRIQDSMDLIEKTRLALTDFWFDRDNCKAGLDAAVSFRRELDKSVSTDKQPIYREKYVHDWSCLSGDTKIRTLRGWVEISKVSKGDYVWGYSEKEHRLVPTEIEWVGPTRPDAEVIEVGLDNGKAVKCTPEHLFMLRDETYRRADELTTNDSLMPFYEVANRGYLQVDLNDGSFADEHRFVHARLNGGFKQDCHVDHIINDHFDNRPTNLQLIHKDEHCAKTFAGKTNAERGQIDLTDYAREVYGRKYMFRICKYCGEEYWGLYKSSYCKPQHAVKQRKCRDKEGLVESRGREKVNAKSREYYANNKEKHRASCKRWQDKQNVNHRVRYVRPLIDKVQTYDITVPETHNFVAEGVVVHNSHGSTALYHFVKARKSGIYRKYANDAEALTTEELMQLNEQYVRPR